MLGEDMEIRMGAVAKTRMDVGMSGVLTLALLVYVTEVALKPKRLEILGIFSLGPASLGGGVDQIGLEG